MSRRKFIGQSMAAVAAGTTLFSKNLIAKPAKFRMRLVMVVNKTLPIWGPGVVSFAEKARIATDGALDIKVYGAGELVPALGTFDAVKAGQVEMAHSDAYYWQGKIPAAPFFTSVPFGLNSEGMRSWINFGGGQELWDELYAPHGVRAFPAGNTGIQMGGWFNKKIETPADFKGLKMRIAGLGGQVLEKLGAKPMLVAGGEIYTNLATGVIDAAEWVGPYHDHVMGFHKAAKFYYYPGWHEPGPVHELMINEQAWQKLPADIQQVVKSLAAELDRNIYAEWKARDSEYLKKIVDEGKVKLLKFPDPVLKALRAQADIVKAEVAATSPLAKKIYTSFTEFQKIFEAHEKITSEAYDEARGLS
ncbi:MAG: TRAP transporter substrate-binding protein [Oligoflexales bacterium]